MLVRRVQNSVDCLHRTNLGTQLSGAKEFKNVGATKRFDHARRVQPEQLAPCRYCEERLQCHTQHILPGVHNDVHERHTNTKEL